MSRTVAGYPSLTAKGRGSPTSGKRRHAWSGPAFVAPHVLGLTAFVVFPIVAALLLSLFEWPLLGTTRFIGLDNFVSILTDDTFWAALRNTVTYVVLYVGCNLVVSLGIATWLGPRMWGRQVFRVLFFIPAVTPVVGNAVVWSLLYQPDGFIDGWTQSLFGVQAPDFLSTPGWAMVALVVMGVWQGFGYNMLIFSAALDAVPDSLLDAGRLDGANAWQAFWHIRFPAISPAIFFGVTMTLITSFQMFTEAFILTKGGPGSSTMTLVLYLYERGFTDQQLGLASAAGTLIFTIILFVTAMQFLGEKRWVTYD
ncbi:MAG: carbohydrate ABC transporter permease [Dermatophilaceae bacterium]